MSPRVACPRIFRKARIVSRRESGALRAPGESMGALRAPGGCIGSSYEFFNTCVEIPPPDRVDAVDRALLLAARGLRAFGFGFAAVLIGVHLERRGLQAGLIGLTLGVGLAAAPLSGLASAGLSSRFGRRRVLAACGGLMAGFRRHPPPPHPASAPGPPGSNGAHASRR